MKILNCYSLMKYRSLCVNRVLSLFAMNWIDIQTNSSPFKSRESRVDSDGIVKESDNKYLLLYHQHHELPTIGTVQPNEITIFFITYYCYYRSHWCLVYSKNCRVIKVLCNFCVWIITICSPDQCHWPQNIFFLFFLFFF